ncbi:MAG: peptide-methionine (S)-S-oxide reductase MsrA [Acidobacteriota bacterium]|nr:peptide-methionine (S)-S-oxide reductase MsrA [Acidobacteriota bacterium]MDH3524333.1 peptide-methionine (S)-S-oxide reductase MsrA [Acidobacteriota bacterium]
MAAWFHVDKSTLPAPADALPGRAEPIVRPGLHRVLGTPTALPFPAGIETACFAMGCFWGAERIFWRTPGVFTTAAGYTAGLTPHPTYEEVCTGATGHAEAVLVGYDPSRLDYRELLALFWEGHDPTQGMRQGNDRGTQYRSGIYTASAAQLAAAEASRAAYQERLDAAGHGSITTQIAPLADFYYAEEYHQQYLDRNPGGYCGLGGTGVACPVGLAAG